MRVSDLDTPAVTVDLDILRSNIKRIQDHLNAHGIKSRPHVKTHKIPAIAIMQMKAGAVGITCQKLGEAEVMVNCGLDDVTIPYNIIGRSKLDRLIRLTRQARITVSADSTDTVSGLEEAAAAYRADINVLVECDTGAHRAGAQSPGEAVELAKAIDSSPHLTFRGFLTYKGGSPDAEHVVYSGRFFQEAVQLASASGLRVETISAGGTVYAYTAWPKYRPHGITENRPGVCVYNDLVKIAQGVATLDMCAMRIVCTVVSRPVADRVIIDGGSKTFTNDGTRWVEGFGHVVEYPEARFYQMSEEHGYIDVSKCQAKPRIGDRLTIIPNYVNGVSNVHDLVYGVQGDEVQTEWAILARGKIR